MTFETKRKLRTVVAHLCALGVALYFLYAAYPKIKEPRQFRIDVMNYRVLPEQYSNLVALFLPWVEVLSAIALIIPRTRRAGAILISGLLLVFIAALYYAAIHLGLDFTCGCTGKDSDKAGWFTIARNVVLLAGTVLSVIWMGRRTNLGPAFPVVTLDTAGSSARPICDIAGPTQGATDVARSVRMSPRTGPG